MFWVTVHKRTLICFVASDCIWQEYLLSRPQPHLRSRLSLYNTWRDPAELEDLAADRPDTVAELQRELRLAAGSSSQADHPRSMYQSISKPN